MKEIRFLVKGSSDKPYEVIFRINEKNLTALCSCPAGLNGLYCKHRLRILQGTKENIISGNLDDVQIIQEWLPGTDIESALEDLSVAEIQLEEQKKKVSSYKKKLARVMMD